MLYAAWIFVLYMFIVGMAAGWAAWALLGKSKTVSKDRRPNWQVLLPLGIAGSFVGGVGMSLLSGEGLALRPSGLIASIAGAVLLVAIYTAVKSR